MNPQDKLLQLSVIQRRQIINSNLVPLNSKPRERGIWTRKSETQLGKGHIMTTTK